jgi:hypothetical protein
LELDASTPIDDLANSLDETWGGWDGSGHDLFT